jgi:hypothetical protein
MFEDSSWMLEVIDGVPPLRLRFSMLTQKYLMLAFLTDGHLLRRSLAVKAEFYKDGSAVWHGWGLRYWNQFAQFTITRLRRYYTFPMSTMWWRRNWILLEGTFTKWWCLSWWRRWRRDLTFHRYFSRTVWSGYPFRCISFWCSWVQLSS